MRNRMTTVASIVFVLCFAVGALAAAGQGASERLTQIRADLVDVKSELGMYSCCIAPSCNFCALATSMCPCGDGAKSGAGVCGECLLGWKAGYGQIAGVEADSVKPLSGDMLEMMYRVRAETMPDKSAAALDGAGHQMLHADGGMAHGATPAAGAATQHDHANHAH